MIIPQRLSPPGAQLGESSSRLAGTFFIPGTQFTQIQPLPLALGAGSVTTDTILVAGFNTFTAFMAVTGASSISLRCQIVDANDQSTIVLSVNIPGGTVNAGAGVVQINWGMGILGGGALSAVAYYLVSLKFQGNAAGAILSQFPGLWAAVR